MPVDSDREPLLLTHLIVDDNKKCPFDHAALVVLRRSFPRLEHMSLRSCGMMWKTHKAGDWAALLGSEGGSHGLRELDVRSNNVPKDVLVALHSVCPKVNY